MIDATARLSHYADHLAPTWLALPEGARGRFYVPEGIAEHVEGLGVEATVYGGDVPPWGDGGPILVAAIQDVRRAVPAGRAIAYAGHGVGQSFYDRPGRRRRGYSGGAGFEAVGLFLAANERHAELWRDAYPAADVEVVGCPKLGGRTREDGPRGQLVVLGFHWRCRIGIPEAGTAWEHYRAALAGLAERFPIALHAHPRIRRNVRRESERIGVRFIECFEEVLGTAAVYANDASSTLYEFAAFGGPVVVLNAPAFRRHVHHGIRFWDSADVGVQVDEPRQLAAAIEQALVDQPGQAARRRQISADLYPYDDPAERAADALLRLAGTGPGALALAGSTNQTEG